MVKAKLSFSVGVLLLLISCMTYAQDLSMGLLVNDLNAHPMQTQAKPAYLDTFTDPSFGTTIRRITDAGSGGVIVPMYSTVQAWNADESFMILYNQSAGLHQLLDGMNYEYIRDLSDIAPDDLEQIFWDFQDPEYFYYPESGSSNFIKYNVNNQAKQIVVRIDSLVGCTNGISMGNDVQMMSWDSDVFGFRCGNDETYYYRISTNELVEILVPDVEYTAAMPAASGTLFYHGQSVYNASGNLHTPLNEASTEHSCLGTLTNGNDAHFAIAFGQGPQGGCIGDMIAHDLNAGICFPLISQSQGYDYPQSGTHISALAHKNTEGGWLAASMIGYDQDGQELLDQELVIAKADQGNIKICRIGHHRSDEDEFDYWGEPHPVISPSGTRVLFASDWSGTEDGESIDCYVVELPAHTVFSSHIVTEPTSIEIFPNPFTDKVVVSGNFTDYDIIVFNAMGVQVQDYSGVSSPLTIDLNALGSGLYFISLQHTMLSQLSVYKIIKQQ